MNEARNRDAAAYLRPVLQQRGSATHRHGHLADMRRKLEGHLLRDVVNDTKSRAFCGPTAVATVVAEPISIVRDAFRLARCGAGWVNYDRAPAIMGTTHHEVEAALRAFGFNGHWQTVRGNPTLADFLEERNGDLRTHPSIIEVTGHWVAVSGWQFCDTLSKGMVVEADEAPGRRKRVKSVFLITELTRPASEIPRKNYSAAKANAGHVRKAGVFWGAVNA